VTERGAGCAAALSGPGADFLQQVQSKLVERRYAVTLDREEQGGATPFRETDLVCERGIRIGLGLRITDRPTDRFPR
jgi:hypothetical protein